MLPEGLFNWVAVYSYFAKWSAPDAGGVSALELRGLQAAGVCAAGRHLRRASLQPATCASMRATASGFSTTPGPGQLRCRSANGASRGRGASRVFCAWTQSIWANSRMPRACIASTPSTPSTRLRSGRWQPQCRASQRAGASHLPASIVYNHHKCLSTRPSRIPSRGANRADS